LALTQLALRVHLLSSISRAKTVREIVLACVRLVPARPRTPRTFKGGARAPSGCRGAAASQPLAGRRVGARHPARSIGVYGLRPALWAVGAKWFFLSFVERRLRRRAREVAEDVVRIRSLAFPCQKNARGPHFPRNISRDVS
jgi:hypothetical protein